MLKIISSTISATTQAHLNNQQADINGQSSYEEQVKRAASLWGSKESSIVKKTSFQEIKEKLTNNAIGKYYCNYCEHNEHSDIEHFYPKSLYPNKAFTWENYIWACKKCNSGYKLDKFKIFNPTNSPTVINITPKYPNRNYIKPANNDTVLINPRVDNPLDYLFLNLQRGIPVIHPLLNNRGRQRAEYTLNLLKLDEREGLIQARKVALKGFINSLKRYIKAKDATSFQELEDSMGEIAPVQFNHSLDYEKSKTCLAIQKDILTRNHLTVWREIQRQNTSFSKLTQLFNLAPEALEW